MADLRILCRMRTWGFIGFRRFKRFRGWWRLRRRLKKERGWRRRLCRKVKLCALRSGGRNKVLRIDRPLAVGFESLTGYRSLVCCRLRTCFTRLENPLQGLHREGHANRASPFGNVPFYAKKGCEKWESFLHSPFSLTTCSLSIS